MSNASDAKSKCAGVTRKRARAGPRACAGAVALETCPLDALLRTSGRAGLDSEGDDWREYATLEGPRWAARHLVSWLFVHSLDFFCDAGMCLLTLCRQGRAMLEYCSSCAVVILPASICMAMHVWLTHLPNH